MENTVSQPSNPLSKYFRQPAIYLRLPSNGQYWPAGSLDLPINGEIPVYPMTARDEITLRTPDALMSGAGVIEVIKSCCPSIVDPWKMPSIDVDTVLIAIRVASYGHDMEIDVNCPHCQTENNFSLDLRLLLNNTPQTDYTTPVETHNLKIKLKPQKFIDVNKTNTVNFEEERLVKALGNQELLEEERIRQVNVSMKKLLDLSIEAAANSTESIEVDGQLVTDSKFISDFYNNAEGAIIRDVQRRLMELSREADLAPQHTNCASCTKEFAVPIEFDYSNFFAVGS